MVALEAVVVVAVDMVAGSMLVVEMNCPKGGSSVFATTRVAVGLDWAVVESGATEAVCPPVTVARVSGMAACVLEAVAFSNEGGAEQLRRATEVMLLPI
jgi:hypothetical protein